jgi:hypothetical protein
VKHGVFSGTPSKIVCAEEIIAVTHMGRDSIAVSPLVDSPVHGSPFSVITNSSDTLHPDLTARAVSLAVLQAKLNNPRATKPSSQYGSVHFVSLAASNRRDGHPSGRVRTERAPRFKTVGTSCAGT